MRKRNICTKDSECGEAIIIKDSKKIKFMTTILLFIFMVYILFFGICIEFIGKNEDRKEIERRFTEITENIKHIHKTGSEDRLHDYLDYLLIHPHMKYMVYCRNGNPEVLYTDEEHFDFKRLDVSGKPRIDINIKNATLEGYIPLDDSMNELGRGLYIGLFRNRSYGLLSGTLYKILLSSAIIMGFLMLLVNWIIYKKIHKPLKEINGFIDELAVGKIPGDMKIDNPRMQGTIKSLYKIRRQILNIKNTTETVQEEVVLGMLNMIEKIIKECNECNEYDGRCAVITGIICKGIKGTIGCSLWLNKTGGNSENLQVYRKETYCLEEQFPAESLTPIAEELVRGVIKHGEIKIIDDFGADADYKHFKDAYPLVAMVVPVWIGGKIMGGLCVWKSRIPYNEAFDFKTRQLLKYIGRIAGSMIRDCKHVPVHEDQIQGKGS